MEQDKKLEDIIGIKGIKLLDTNVLNSEIGHGIMPVIYECEHPEDLPVERLEKEIEHISDCLVYLSRDDTFSIEEVGKEVNESMKIANNTLRYFGKLNEDSSDSLGYSSLGAYAKRLLNLSRKAKRRDIKKRFSNREELLYHKLFSYFSDVAEVPRIKRISHSSQEFSGNGPEFGTDEKILAAAITLAYFREDKVILVSSDFDIKRMGAFFYSDSGDFNRSSLPSPSKEKLLLYSTYLHGYESQDLISSNISPNLKTPIQK